MGKEYSFNFFIDSIVQSINNPYNDINYILGGVDSNGTRTEIPVTKEIASEINLNSRERVTVKVILDHES